MRAHVGVRIYNETSEGNNARRCIVFDSPFGHCQVCGETVLLDQTPRECAREHRCRKDVVCPLEKYFTGIDFSVEQPKEKLHDKGY